MIEHICRSIYSCHFSNNSQVDG